MNSDELDDLLCWEYCCVNHNTPELKKYIANQRLQGTAPDPITITGNEDYATDFNLPKPYKVTKVYTEEQSREKGKITKVGIVKDGTAIGWVFDSAGRDVAGVTLKQDGNHLNAGYTIQELKDIIELVERERLQAQIEEAGQNYIIARVVTKLEGKNSTIKLETLQKMAEKRIAELEARLGDKK